MDVEIAFTGVPVSTLAAGRDFFERLLGRPADVEVTADEVMWCLVRAGLALRRGRPRPRRAWAGQPVCRRPRRGGGRARITGRRSHQHGSRRRRGSQGHVGRPGRQFRVDHRGARVGLERPLSSVTCLSHRMFGRTSASPAIDPPTRQEISRTGRRAEAGYRSQLSEVESRKSKVESRKSKVESRKSKVESRKSKVESRKSKVESRKSGRLLATLNVSVESSRRHPAAPAATPWHSGGSGDWLVAPGPTAQSRPGLSDYTACDWEIQV